MDGQVDFVQKPKTMYNNCYIDIPIVLTHNLDHRAVEIILTFLATTFADNSADRLLDMCLVALSFCNIPTPRKIIILRGPGGDGKSARSHLRNNVMAG